jgi:hypothetical protein
MLTAVLALLACTTVERRDTTLGCDTSVTERASNNENPQKQTKTQENPRAPTTSPGKHTTNIEPTLAHNGMRTCSDCDPPPPQIPPLTPLIEWNRATDGVRVDHTWRGDAATVPNRIRCSVREALRARLTDPRRSTAVLALRAEVGADGLAFIISRCAAAEHERRSWRGLAGARR